MNLSLIAFALIALAQDSPYGAAIPNSDWAVVEDPSRGIYDAVILDDRRYFLDKKILRYRKIRILSENGKSAAQMMQSSNTKQFKGRVLYPNGTMREINTKEDLVETLLFKHRGSKEKIKTLLIPGLTKNCIVEYEWLDELEFSFFFSANIHVQEPYYVKRKSFHRSKRPNFNAMLPGRITWTEAAPEHMSLEDEGLVLIYKNIDPEQTHPYGNYHYNPKTILYSIFPSLDVSTKNIEAFWQEYTRRYIIGRNYDEKVPLKGDYKAWLAAVKPHLPSDPVEAATDLLQRLRQRVACQYMTPSQAEVLEDTKFTRQPGKASADAFEKGFATPKEMATIFIRTLEHCDIPYTMLFCNSINSSRFIPGQLRAYSVDDDNPLVLVKNFDNKAVYLSPTRVDYSPGVVPPQYDGINALAFHPSRRTISWENIPFSNANAHTMITQNKTTIHEDGSFDLSSSRQVSGTYEALFRRAYYRLYKEEQDQSLFEEWENPSVYQIMEASVEGGSSLVAPVSENVTIKGQLAINEAMALLHPFPNAQRPLSHSTLWPEGREEPIFLPNPFYHVSMQNITLPAGWTIKGEPSWQRSNAIGSITYGVKQEGNTLLVRCDIMVKSSRLKPSAESDLKVFLAWQQEALNQELAFDRSPTATTTPAE